MKYILDTDIISYYLGGDQQIVTKFEKIRLNQLGTTVINYSELMFGVKKNKNKKLHRLIVEFCKKIRIFKYNLQSAEIYSNIKVELLKKGEIIQDMDMMIAGICIANDLTLVTNNYKHFRGIRRLKVEEWER